ncbi:MAG TPA: sigma-70 family RNA polymerase sigma factor [Gemmatimonadales bacterium]|nr:sigma-70 family RNA polymerase sigma factor [Gemmatimonadales bacterium]
MAVRHESGQVEMPVNPSPPSGYEQTVLPHLDAAYALARFLVRDDHDAEDVVQDAYLRALRYFGSYRGGDARTWLLAIVRRTCYTWLRRRRVRSLDAEFDERVHGVDAAGDDPATLATRGALKDTLLEAVERLPVEFREVVVLRDIEGLSYREIAQVAGVPVGTVMSRLSRARRRLHAALSPADLERS